MSLEKITIQSEEESVIRSDAYLNEFTLTVDDGQDRKYIDRPHIYSFTIEESRDVPKIYVGKPTPINKIILDGSGDNSVYENGIYDDGIFE